MEKVIYLVWRDHGTPTADWSATLRGAVTGRLADAGATGVQVNVADDAVAGALMRLAALDPQPEAVVGLWVDSARDAARRSLDDALAASPGTARIAGYLVTESVPLRNTAHPAGPGERTDGFANIALLRRPGGMTQDEWIDAWHNGHTDVANETQSTFGYVQNVVARPLTPGAPAVDGIVEELFPIEALTSLHAFFAAADDDELARNLERMTESTARFGADRDIDVIPTSRYVMG
jgi:EthD domain